MSMEANDILGAMAIGLGATLLMDLWNLFLKMAFGIPSLDYCLLGRWLLHMPGGTFRHASIAAAPRKPFECAVGRTAHYTIGVVFALVFVALASGDWLARPTLLPALLFGLGTVVFPFFIMQPSFGLGFAASKTPRPAQARLKSLATHTVFGVGLYVCAQGGSMANRVLIGVMTGISAASLAVAADETAWTWSGLEILGNHGVPRAEIEKMIPIPIGGVYHRSDAPFWTESCAEVRRKFDFAAVDCGDRALRVFDGRKAYLIVDIVEKGREDVLKFRDAPSGSVAFASDEMVNLGDEVASKSMAAAMAGHYYSEHGDKGYLTYEDPTGSNEDLGPLVKRLTQLVPQNLDNVFDVLQHEKDPRQREKAGALLNWARGDMEGTLRRALPLLDDPDFTVRNSLSRFMMHFVGSVQSKRLRHRMIAVFVDEIGRPSHLDRNKGLANLLEIAKARPDDRGYIRSRGTESIKYLAENSIVFNVKGPAEELLALLDPTSKPEAAGSSGGR